MIDLTINEKVLEKTIEYCRQKGIILPTFSMMKNPGKIPDKIKEKLKKTGLWDVSPLNLFRITWKNEPKESGGLFGEVNHFILPESLTGVKAKIIFLCGKWFPTGAHKVGATYGCLVPRLVTGQFDPTKTKAVWPSTGNYCRGGAYISALLACEAIAILPEGMSKERFDWLKKIAGEVIATPGCESNVKEIFDKCHELRNSGRDLMIFNQFDELGNPLWHFTITGPSASELIEKYIKKGKRYAGYIASSGSGGTLGGGYYLKLKYPRSKLAAAEAIQCPTLLLNGFGDHRIEGIGDKHVPWVHDCKETNFVIGVDDETPIRLLRLFNEKTGHKILESEGVEREVTKKLHLLGISGIGNMIAAIKFAKYNELTADDIVVTIATDSMELYGSRLKELEQERGPYTEKNALMDMELIGAITTDNMKELLYYDKKSIHNLKYFTWIEQQGKDVSELNAQWYDHDNYWYGNFNKADEIDNLIEEFNRRTGLLK